MYDVHLTLEQMLEVKRWQRKHNIPSSEVKIHWEQNRSQGISLIAQHKNLKLEVLGF